MANKTLTAMRWDLFQKLQASHHRPGRSRAKPKRSVELWHRGGAVAISRGKRKRVYSPTKSSARRVQHLVISRPKKAQHKTPEGIRVGGF